MLEIKDTLAADFIINIMKYICNIYILFILYEINFHLTDNCV